MSIYNLVLVMIKIGDIYNRDSVVLLEAAVKFYIITILNALRASLHVLL